MYDIVHDILMAWYIANILANTVNAIQHNIAQTALHGK